MKSKLRFFLQFSVSLFFIGVTMAQESNQTDSLYSELKPDVQTLVESLIDATMVFIKNQGQYLPVGKIHNNEKKIEMVAAMDSSWDKRDVSTTEVLPVLHEAIKNAISSGNGIATGVVEDVTITLEGQKPTKAIKVLFEHKRGLTISVYLPYHKNLFGSIKTGEMFIKAAKPEVCAWQRK
jgi:hypothetical protein